METGKSDVDHDFVERFPGDVRHGGVIRRISDREQEQELLVGRSVKE